MYPVDVISSYAICGASGLVGAVLMRDALAPDARSRQVLRDYRSGLWLLAVCLLQLVVIPEHSPDWSQVLIVIGAAGYALVLTWTLAPLSGPPLPRTGLQVSMALVVLAAVAAQSLGPRALATLLAWELALSSLALVWAARGLLLRPRNAHERLFGVMVALMVPVHLLRAGYTSVLPEPVPRHLLLVPEPLLAPMALMYGVLPMLNLVLLFNALNARRQERLHEGMMSDQLTGALNRHALTPGVRRLRERAAETGQCVALVLADLDHFKRVNDVHGHPVGDQVLRRLAAKLREGLRPEALVVRLGGEEFLVLFVAPDIAHARHIAERLRNAVAQPAQPLPAVTASFGVALLEAGENVEQAIARADEALYRAKHGGRNQVQVALAAA